MKRFLLPVCSLLVIALTGITPPASAQSVEGYLYGRVALRNGDTFEGPIRWGDDEVFWLNIFNSTKIENTLERFRDDLPDYHRLMDEIYDEHDRSRDRRRVSILGYLIGDDGTFMTDREFSCHFGDIRRLDIRWSDGVLLTLKNGEQLELEGGSTDIGATVHVLDDELGEVKLPWRGIDFVEFLATPSRLRRTYGEPLYGVVQSRLGSFAGLIQWDSDERLGSDVLDGDSEYAEMEIEFSEIAAIERRERGSLVTLNSGREYFLTGSNDVNRENRGIIVNTPDVGSVTIGWRDFDRVDFADARDSGPGYNSFAPTTFIEATVRTWNDETFSGRIFYDLDEAFDFEMLNGDNEDCEFLIPFRNIASITPERRWGSTVHLKNDLELRLDGSNDIDESNDGIVIWSGSDSPRYFLWSDVREIVFR